MPANIGNMNVFDFAKYTVFRVRERRPRPDDGVVEYNLPICLVQLAGDSPDAAFWMSPAPQGATYGSLSDAMGQPLNMEVLYVDGPGAPFPAGGDNLGSFAIHQWSGSGF